MACKKPKNTMFPNPPAQGREPRQDYGLCYNRVLSLTGPTTEKSRDTGLALAFTVHARE